MTKRFTQLFEAFVKLSGELESLMPQQYKQPTKDSLGLAWQQAVGSLEAAGDYLFELHCDLEYKAKRADERKAAGVVPNTGDEDEGERRA